MTNKLFTAKIVELEREYLNKKELKHSDTNLITTLPDGYFFFGENNNYFYLRRIKNKCVNSTKN